MDLNFCFPFKDVPNLKAFLNETNRPNIPPYILNKLNNSDLPKLELELDEDDDTPVNISSSDQCSYVTTDKLNANCHNSLKRKNLWSYR